MDLTKIDAGKLRDAIVVSKFGTGSVCDAAHIPHDALQRMLAIGEGDPAHVKALSEVLKTDSFVGKNETRVRTIDEAKAYILEGTNTERQGKRAVEVYEEELAQDKPRKSLLKWLKEEFGIPEED